MSRAASAQYGVGCPFCGAKPYKPCESIQTRRVTDTHQARIEAQHRAPGVRDVYPLWRAAEAMRLNDNHPTLMAVADAMEQHAPEHRADCDDSYCRGLFTLAEGYLAWSDSRDSHACNTDNFDRTICPEPCGDMHYYCTACGKRQDRCAHDQTA